MPRSPTLREIAFFLDMEEVPFKPRAYEKAVGAIEATDTPIAERYRTGGLNAVEKIPGVGRSIAEKIATYPDRLDLNVKVITLLFRHCKANPYFLN